ncbi:MAG: ABC transporter permease [Cellvibrionaceae bacterium]
MSAISYSKKREVNINTRRNPLRPLALSAFIVALFILLPIVVVVAAIFSGSFEVWRHLFSTVLSSYLSNSIALMFGVGIGVVLVGVPTAWLTARCDFPGRRLFTWALLLPLSMPAYIIAYTYTGMLDFAGPIQTLIRELTGWEYGDYWFFDIRSLTGAMLMLTLVLYPYVYLLARSAFLEQSPSIMDASRTLGYGGKRAFLRLHLPMARPAIITGLTLALMETLADYGTVQYFGISTFTTGIFRTFYGFGDTAAAAQLAAVLLGFITLLIFLERYSRQQARYHTMKGKPAELIKLSSGSAWVAVSVCALPLLLGFIIPAGQLLYWSVFESLIQDGFFKLAWNSFYLALSAAAIAVVLALLLAYAKRVYIRKKSITAAVSLAGLGYALPGTIIAIGVIIPLAWFDNHLIIFLEKYFDVNIGLLLSGTLIALLFAYTVRFLAVSLGTIESGLQQVKPSLDNAARLMGYRPAQVLEKIHLPLLKGSILTAFLIVFVDVLKELPATLILRPFNFDTLAVKAYELASDERLVDAAPASLLIVLVGLIPVILLSRSITVSNQLK